MTPVIWLQRIARATARVLQFVITGLTLWLPGTAVATVVALLVVIWIWTGTPDSLARLVSAARPLSPALTHLTWTGTGATVRHGGHLGHLSWQQDGLSVEAHDAFIGWEWLAQGPQHTPPAGPPAARFRITVKASGVQVSDQRPASQAPPSPPDSLALPWPLNSWAAPVELAFDIGAITLKEQPGVALSDINGRHLYAPTQADWAHNLTLHASLRHHEATAGHAATPAQARYTLQAQAQANHPLAMQASLTGDVSGTFPGHTPAPKGRAKPSGTSPLPGTPTATATPTWQGQLTANLAGQLAGPQAVLQATANLTSRTAAGRTTQTGPTGPAAPSAQLDAEIHPWARQPIGRLASQMAHLDLSALWPDLPRTRLSGHAHAHPTPHDTWGFDLDIANGASGPWDRQSLPVTQLKARGELSTGTGQVHTTVRLDELLAQVGGGQVSAQGDWRDRSWQGALSASGIRADALHSALPPTVLQGTVRAAPDTTTTDPGLALTVALTASPTTNRYSNEVIPKERQSRFSSYFSWRQDELNVRSLQLNSHGGVLSAQGRLNTGQLSLSGQAELTVPGLHVQAKGSLSSDEGSGKLAARLTQADALAQWLRQLPLWPSTWLPPAISGAAELDASWAGGWASTPTIEANVHAPYLTGRLPQQTSNAQTATERTWSASGLTWTVAGSPAKWQSALNGNLRWQQWSARLATRATGAFGATEAADTPDLTRGEVTLQALQLGVAAAPTGATSAGAAADPPAQLHATLAAATDIQWNAGGLRLAPGMLRLHANPHPAAASGAPSGASLSWGQSTWAGAQVDASGDIAGINLDLARALVGLAAPSPGNADPLAGWLGDLTLGGPWQARWPGTPQVPARLSASLNRQTGDLLTPLGAADNEDNPPDNASTHQALGIRTAHLALTGDAQQWSAELDWASRAGGQARGNVQLAHATPTAAASTWPTADSRLSGQLSVQLPRAGVWSRLAPPGWRITGSMALDAQLGGTLGQPTWQGNLSGRNLSARSAVEGLAYTQGELDATLSSNQVDITQFTLQGAGGPSRGGSLHMTGQATWSAADKAPRIRLDARADKLNVSARADRRLTLSGNATATVAENTLTLRGQLKADQAQFTLPDEFAPTLGPDVVVRLNRSAQPPTRAIGLRTDVAVDIDLGPAFDVRGQGLQTRLTGQLRVSSPPGSDAFGVTGEVRATSGTYRAYGQQLRIEEGVLRFSGPYDDPTLSILALRGTTNTTRTAFGNDDQQVGVKVTGSARNPRLQLYASPDLPDSEKLAWLVLGRPASGAGAEAAIMQQAAMALLGNQVRGLEGSLANALGLDELGVSTATANSGTTQTGAAVTLGKRLSSRLYVTYQHSLDSTAGALNLFYDVSRRLTVRAQMGSESALDLIFTLPHD